MGVFLINEGLPHVRKPIADAGAVRLQPQGLWPAVAARHLDDGQVILPLLAAKRSFGPDRCQCQAFKVGAVARPRTGLHHADSWSAGSGSDAADLLQLADLAHPADLSLRVGLHRDQSIQCRRDHPGLYLWCVFH
ncbi:hypothetical protein D3C76_673150 [compost metagenome]